MLHGELGMGWLCFLCNLRLVEDASSAADGPHVDVPVTAPGQLGSAAGLNEVVVISPKDSYHKRVYLQPLGLYLHAEAGSIAQVVLDMRQQSLNVSITALGEQLASRVRVRADVAAEQSQEAGLLVQAVQHGPCCDIAPACMATTVALVRGSFEVEPCNAQGLHTSQPWLILKWSWGSLAAATL